jgi:hypothetical protein
MITYVTLFLPKICVKAKYIFGTEACACLDTSRRRFAPPSQAHATKQKGTKGKSKAERCGVVR